VAETSRRQGEIVSWKCEPVHRLDELKALELLQQAVLL
jgi:hypothetical protein